MRPSIPAAGKFSSFYNLILQSLRGEETDYTQGSIRRAVILLAIPMMLEMIMESVFAVVDIFFVSHLGKHATSTVGLTESVITIVYSLAIGISMAATAVVARRVGEKDYAAANRAGMQAIILAIALTAVISVTGFLFAEEILELMGAEPETIREGKNYTRVLFGGSVVIMLLFLINGIFRGAGNAMMAMKSLWVANICNIILCPLLIRGLGPIPAFGVTGAAMATTIGRGVGVGYQLYHLNKGKGIIRINWRHLEPAWDIIRSLVKIAWPATLQFLIGSGSWIVLASLVVHTGHSEASAGYQIAIRIVMFFILPAWGLSNAAATLVGQNLGAGNPQRAVASVMKTVKYNALFMGLVSIVFLAFAEWIIAFFTRDPVVSRYAVQAMRIMSTGYIFYGIGMVMANALNGAGDTRTPTIINLFGFWAFQVPLAWLLAKTFGWGPIGVFWAIPIAETAISMASWVMFRKGKWKTIKV
ncbi:MAG: MATE family efflux transporter [Chitinophagaceae bacterium]|jgi:putative MATE family efflux protein|nr:MATE family efflux transporter [Chitinophagaceae bacterium]